MSLGRRFPLLVAVLLIAVGFALSWFLDRAAVDQSLKIAEQQNIGLARTLASTLRLDIRAFRSDARTMDVEALRSDPKAAAFRTALQVNLTGLPIAKIKIYDAGGLTIFSTERAQIGEDKSGNAGFRRALAGGIATELTFRNKFSAFDAEIVHRNMLSSYVPVEDSSGKIDTVFEIYQDVTELLDELRQARLTRDAAVLGSLALVYVLVLVLRRRS